MYIAITFTLSFLDYLSTIYAFGNGAVEINPTNQFLLQFGLWGFFIGRVIFSPIGLIGIAEYFKLLDKNLDFYIYIPAFIAWSFAIIQNIFGFL